jgi:hypothetical protein
MMQGMYPNGVLNPDDGKCSVQSLLFGHRIKPQETRYEYLVEFLQVSMAHKKILGCDNENDIITDMFPISDSLNNHQIEYMPISNMGLKRFIFFENSRLDTKSRIDKEAYEKCLDILREHIEIENSQITDKDSIFILQNILYGFSIENAGRSWFNKNLLPVCPEALFPESLARKKLREGISLDSSEIDSSFDFNSYTYMARGGEVYYLHLLHAINNGGNQKKEKLEHQIRGMLTSIPQISRISRFIQKEWIDGMELDEPNDSYPDVKKKLGAIPLEYSYRDEKTLSEVICFLDNRINPMEKLNLLSYGMVLQLFRLIITIAANGCSNAGSAWMIDVCDTNKKEHAEIRKLAAHCYAKNEESITKYIDIGINYYFNDVDATEKDKKRKDADKDSNKIIRKLGKNMGMIIPLTGPAMRFTLSEELIKFLVMSLVPASSKVTFDHFLDMLYDHYEIVITPEHYAKAASEGKIVSQGNVTFLQANKGDFAQKLKNCGFLRDLSDATSIVENPYEKEES